MFSGTFEQALDAFRRSSQADIQRFIEFMDVHPNTVGGWLLGTSKLPTGETKIRALCYFNLSDWKVSDFEKLDSLAKEMALLLGLRVTSLSEMLEELGLSANYGTGILGFLYGEKELTNTTRKLAQRYVAEKAEDLEHAREKLKNTYKISESSTTSWAKASTAVSGDAVVELARLLNEAYGHAIELNSDDYTDAQRARMRELVGPQRYVELSVTLAQMKSARTRDLHRKKD